MTETLKLVSDIGGAERPHGAGTSQRAPGTAHRPARAGPKLPAEARRVWTPRAAGSGGRLRGAASGRGGQSSISLRAAAGTGALPSRTPATPQGHRAPGEKLIKPIFLSMNSSYSKLPPKVQPKREMPGLQTRSVRPARTTRAPRPGSRAPRAMSDSTPPSSGRGPDGRRATSRSRPERGSACRGPRPPGTPTQQ